MTIEVQGGKLKAIYKISIKCLEEAIQYTNIGDLGISIEKPIILDPFLILIEGDPNDLIPTIGSDDVLKAVLVFNDDKYKPQLISCSGVNLTKENEGFQWNNYFVFKEFIPIGNTIEIKPTNGLNECSITVAQIKDQPLPNIYITYCILISLDVNVGNGDYRKRYFKMDPLVKVSSTQDDLEDN